MSEKNLPAAPRPPIMAGAPVSALVPQTLDEAFRLANAMAASGLAPKGMDKPEQCLVAIMAGAELGFAPFQATQSFAVVNNRPSIWGDAIPALLWSRGFDLEEWFDDDDSPTKAFCKITRPSGKEVVRTYSLKDAKDAALIGKAGPWQTARKRMLQMRARAFAARDGAADVLRGMPVYEEIRDHQPIGEVSARGPGLRERLEARREPISEGFTAHHGQTADETLAGDDIPRHDAETGEIIDAVVEPAAEAESAQPTGTEQAEPPAGAGEPMSLGQLIEAYEGRLRAAPNKTKLQAVRAANQKLLDRIDRADPEKLGELDGLFNDLFVALDDAEKAKAAQ